MKGINAKYTLSQEEANPVIRKSPNFAQRNLYKASGVCLALSLFIIFAPISPIIGFAFAALCIGTTFKFIRISPGVLSVNGFLCNYGLSDTGLGCVVLQKVAQRMFMVPFYNNFGSQNGIRLNGTVSTTTNGTFTQPGYGFTVSVTFTSTAGFYQGMVFRLADSTSHTGWYSVTSITSTTVAVVTNIGIVDTSAQGVTVATAAAVTDVVPFNVNYYTNMINHPDPSQRWYPTPLFKNASNKRAASIMKSYDDQSESRVQLGIRKFSAIVAGKLASPQLLSFLNVASNVEFGVYIIDKDMNQVGQMDNIQNVGAAGWLYPLKVDANSLDPIYNPGDDKNEAELMLNFNFDTTVIDQNINGLAGSLNNNNGDIDPGANLWNIPGMISVSSVISAIATSTAGTFTMQLKTLFGSALTVLNDTGLVLSNLISPVTGLSGKVYDATADADITVTSVTEVLSASNGRPTGVYNVLLGSDPAASNKISIGIARSNKDYSTIPGQGGVDADSSPYTFASV